MRWPLPGPDDRVLREQLNRIERNTEAIMSEQSTTQADIDAATTAITSLTATVTTVAADLETAKANILAEIAALQAANPAVDTSALDTAVAGLSAPLSALQSADTDVDSLETPATPPAS
jgi:predicted negative regulator of RcsB-dependent stress response